jgi:hypothetical protein
MSPHATSAAVLSQRINDLESQIRADRDRLNRGSALTLAVGIVVLAILSAYFFYGYSQLSTFLKHENLVDAAEHYVIQTVQDSRVAAERHVKENAPSWAEMSSKSVVEAVPDLRVKLQGLVFDSVDGALKEGAKASGDVFGEFLKKNRTLVHEGIIKLSGKPEDAEAFITDVAIAMQNELEGDVRNPTKELYRAVQSLTDLLQKTKTDGPLPPVLASKRELFMLWKRWLLDAAPPPAPGTTKA